MFHCVWVRWYIWEVVTAYINNSNILSCKAVFRFFCNSSLAHSHTEIWMIIIVLAAEKDDWCLKWTEILLPPGSTKPRYFSLCIMFRFVFFGLRKNMSAQKLNEILQCGFIWSKCAGVHILFWKMNVFGVVLDWRKKCT